MGECYVIATGACIACGTLINFNPNRVPSIRCTNGRPDPAGKREPLCRGCAEIINDQMERRGEPRMKIPEDAYSMIREEELL